MILIGGTLSIDTKKDKLVFGKCNRSGKAEKAVVMALLGDLYSGNEELIILHIVSSKSKKPINKKNLKGLGEIVHNYQNSSKENSDFVEQFKRLSASQREKVLDAIIIRNRKRDEDCKAYKQECGHHRELVNIGEKQYEKLENIHSMMRLDPRSKLHMWSNPRMKFTDKQKNRLSKKEKKELKKQHKKSKKKKSSNKGTSK